MNLTGELKDTLSSRGLASINMGKNAYVSILVQFSHDCSQVKSL
jgi:hypothetical protein